MFYNRNVSVLSLGRIVNIKFEASLRKALKTEFVFWYSNLIANAKMVTGKQKKQYNVATKNK